MKFNTSHIILIVFFIVFNIENSTVMAFQEPNMHRTFDPNFKDHYSGNTYNYEGKKVVKKSEKGSGNYEDYKNKKPKVKEEDTTSNFNINLGPLAWVFYFAIAVGVGYLIYVLFNEGGSGLFSSKGNKKITDFEDITSENIENADINALITRAENNQDYRLAIRYYYLLVLKTLTLKNHIKFEDDKTNADYLNDIKSKPFSADFEYISYLYNYIWYGEFPLDIEQYAKAKAKFVTLLNQIK